MVNTLKVGQRYLFKRSCPLDHWISEITKSDGTAYGTSSIIIKCLSDTRITLTTKIGVIYQIKIRWQNNL